MHALVEAWRALDVAAGAAPYILPADRDLIAPGRHALYSSYVDYWTRNNSDPKHTQFHLNLLPMPFMGDLQTAKIVLLMLNPGFDSLDYAAELGVPQIRESFIKNLRQDLGGQFYPFASLDPYNVLHPGYHYWERKFRPIAETLCMARSWTYVDALSALAEQVAALELVPYHSKGSPRPALVRDLPSTQLAVDYARSELKQRAANGDTLVIVLRGAARWGLTDSKRVIVYPPKQARSASLSLDSPGGQAILHHFGLTALDPSPSPCGRRG